MKSIKTYLRQRRERKLRVWIIQRGIISTYAQEHVTKKFNEYLAFLLDATSYEDLVLRQLAITHQRGGYQFTYELLRSSSLHLLDRGESSSQPTHSI